MDIMEIYYMIMNKPYFKVYVLSNGRKIKTFIQLAAVSDDKNKAYIYFLICRPLRLAWRKPEKPIIDGVKFEAHVNLRNAIPLLIKTEKEYITEDFTIKEYEKETIEEDMEKQRTFPKPKTGAPETMVEIAYPPNVLFDELEAVFVDKTIAPATTRADDLKKLLPYILIGGAIILLIILNKGQIPFLPH